MTLVALILLCVAVILLAATAPKPTGWIALALTVIALLIVVLGGLSIHLGK